MKKKKKKKREKSLWEGPLFSFKREKIQDFCRERLREDEEEEEEGKVCVRERERKDGRGSPVHLATSTRFWKYLCHKRASESERERSPQHPSSLLSLERRAHSTTQQHKTRRIGFEKIRPQSSFGCCCCCCSLLFVSLFKEGRSSSS